MRLSSHLQTAGRGHTGACKPFNRVPQAVTACMVSGKNARSDKQAGLVAPDIAQLSGLGMPESQVFTKLCIKAALQPQIHRHSKRHQNQASGSRTIPDAGASQQIGHLSC